MENKEAIRMLWKQKEYLRKETELKYADTATLDRTCYGALTRAIEALHAEKPKGEWINDEGYAMCPFCSGKSVNPQNFCPNCGADLREEDESDDE